MIAMLSPARSLASTRHLDKYDWRRMLQRQALLQTGGCLPLLKECCGVILEVCVVLNTLEDDASEAIRVKYVVLFEKTFYPAR